MLEASPIEIAGMAILGVAIFSFMMHAFWIQPYIEKTTGSQS